MKWSCKDYKEIEFKDRSFIYCDPPYHNTTQYYGQNFNSIEFFDWFREISKEHYCILSEYEVPPDFSLLTKIETRLRLDGNNSSSRIDKLFYCDGLFKDWFEN